MSAVTETTTRPDTAVRENPARDTWNVLARELKPVVRDPFTLIFSLVQPLVSLGLFAPLLVGSSGRPVGETVRRHPRDAQEQLSQARGRPGPLRRLGAFRCLGAGREQRKH